MGRTVRSGAPKGPRPVEKVELSGRNFWLRFAAMIFFLVVGAAALAYGISHLISGESGWREIKAYSGEGVTCGDDFVFMYDVGSRESVSKENRAVTGIYSEAAKAAYELFNADTEIENVHNLKYISLHPNEEIEVDEGLYSAFEKYVSSGDRLMYLGPAYSIYDSMFYLSDPSESLNFDPEQNEEVAGFFAEAAEYAKSPDDVDLKLLGGNKVELAASREYLNFLKENECESIIDFYWLKNAFITDFIADRLVSAGYTCGTVSSYDGFTRNLDGRGESFSLTLYHLIGKEIFPAAIVDYKKPIAIASLRSYPIVVRDSFRYLDLGDRTASQYLDIADGQNRCSLDEITAYSEELSCADIALKLAPVFISDEFDENSAAELKAAGVDSLRFDGGDILYTDADLTFREVYGFDGGSFSPKLIK